MDVNIEGSHNVDNDCSKYLLRIISFYCGNISFVFFVSYICLIFGFLYVCVYVQLCLINVEG